MSADVIEFMDEQKIDKAHIGGYSMGGFVTAGILATQPGRFLSASFGGSGLTETDEWAASVPPDKEGPAPDEALATAQFRDRPEVPGQEVGNAAARQPRAGVPAIDRSEFLARQRALSASIDLTKLEFPIIAINGEPWGDVQPTGKTHRLADVKLEIPVIPKTFYCAGINYATHIREMAEKRGVKPVFPEKADIGYRANNALIAHGQNVVIPADALYRWMCSVPWVSGARTRTRARTE